MIVTTFMAGAQNPLPLWIFGNIRQGQSLPQTNVVVLFVIALTFVPVVSPSASRATPGYCGAPVPTDALR